MPYGTVKVDNITFDNGGADQNVTASGIYKAITSGVTVSGTISGAVIIGGTSVSGTIVRGTTVTGTTVQGVSGTFTALTGITTTGTTANFASGVFTTQISGLTVTGTTAQFTSGTFVSLTGTTVTGTTINAGTVISTTGTFTSFTGTTITGATVQGTTVVATTGNFTSLTGITTTGTTANFTSGIFTTQVSGLTVTGTQSSFTSGNFVTLSGDAVQGNTGTFTSGVFASGLSAANPSISFVGDPNTGIYSPGADTLAFVKGGVEEMRITSAGLVGIGTSAPTEKLTVSGNVSVSGNVQAASINNGPLAGFRNAIINGNFDHWQRGTSFTGSDYGADRWRITRTGTTATFSQQSFTVGQPDVPNEPTYFSRTVVTSSAGAGNFCLLEQRIEGVRSFAGSQVTVSFWAKADSSKPIFVEMLQRFGTGGSPSSDVLASGNAKVTLSATWQKVTLTLSIPSISGKTLGSDNNHNLGLLIWFDAGSSFNARTDTLGQQSGTFDIAQVQIEAGSVATALERRPIGTELALCQRYFNKSYAVGTNPGTVTTAGQFSGSFAAAGTGSMTSIVRYPVVMRSTATVTIYNPVTGASNSARRGGSNITPTQGSGADSGVIVIIGGGSSADNYDHHYTASAEL